MVLQAQMRGQLQNRLYTRYPRSVTVLILICGMMLLIACSRRSSDRIELHDIAEDSRQGSLQQRLPAACPTGDPPGNDVSSPKIGGHTVILRWNASAPVDGQEMLYCLYRTIGGRVQKNRDQGKKSPCVNCQRVTLTPVSGTTYKDNNVENDSHYCYVAIAISPVNGLVSDFSTQIDAVIPPRKEPPFCEALGGENQNRSSPHRGH